MEKTQYETSVVKPNLTIYENDQECRLISILDELSLDNLVSQIENYMINNDGKGKSDAEKDNLYGGAKDLWNQYAALLKNVKYTFYLNRKQYQFLTDLLLEKLEYDVNTVFFAIELTNMLGTWKESGTAKDDKTLQAYTSDATEITYIYHLIAKHKVKGLSHSSYRFAEVLKKIGDISKIIGYYDTHAKNFSKMIQDWVAAFEDGIVVESLENKKKAKKSKETPVEESTQA
jgi:hypothetical protein